MIQNAKKRILSLQGKILLGLSGGPDSMCLYHLLKECKKDFVVAHVDHGLRESSKGEREQLELLAKEDRIPFFHTRLSDIAKSNVEEDLREKRISFFKGILEQNGLDMLLLGHQKDERAETVIKRFFEGGSLSHLPALKEQSVYEGMKVIRPLLQTTKKEVVAYLHQKGAFYFTDPTNFGEGNLRARMRSHLIPLIEEAFGKNVVHSICSRADQIERMDAFVQREVAKLAGKEEVGVFGVFFPKEKGVDAYIFLTWVFQWMKAKGILLSRMQKDWIREAAFSQAYGKKIDLLEHSLFVEGEGIFVLEKKALSWRVVVDKGTSWKDIWRKGDKVKGCIPLTEEAFAALLHKKKKSEYHRLQKTPLCLRSLFSYKEI